MVYIRITWTSEQITAAAPDAQVGKAAQKLARPGKWQSLGGSAQAIWGEQKGSGSNPYQVAVDLSGPAFRCGCPSRKRPCKHAIGLFLLAEAEPQIFPETTPPDWVQKWLAGRVAAVAKKNRSTTRAVDPDAQARREARREKRVRQGVMTLRQWLDDLIHQGLGNLSGQPATFWENQAARLVDAQAPGLARRVRALATIPLSGEGWPGRMMDHLARLYLLLEAFDRIESLPVELQGEIRGQIGWTQSQDDLRSRPGDRDRWLVLGQIFTEEERLHVRRTWLWGSRCRQAALLLDFAPPGQTFESGFAPGTAMEAELVFWPSSYPQRALVKHRAGVEPIADLAGYPSLQAALAAYGAALAVMPWLERFLMPVTGAVPIRQPSGWAVRDTEGGLLPLALGPNEGWRLLALSGGQPLTLVSEWNGEYLTPLSAWTGEELILITDRSL